MKPDKVYSYDDVTFPHCIVFYICKGEFSYKYVLNWFEMLQSVDPILYIDMEIKIIKEKFNVQNL